MSSTALARVIRPLVVERDLYQASIFGKEFHLGLLPTPGTRRQALDAIMATIVKYRIDTRFMKVRISSPDDGVGLVSVCCGIERD